MKEGMKEGTTHKAGRRRAARFSSAAALVAVAVALAVLGTTGAAAPGAPGAGGAILPDVMAQVQEQGEPSGDPEADDAGAPSEIAAVGDEASEPDDDPQPAGQAASAGDLPDHEAGIALARLADGADEAAFREAAVGLPGVEAVEGIEYGLATVRLADGADEVAAMAALEALDQVDFSQPNFFYYSEAAAGATAQGKSEGNASFVAGTVSRITNDPLVSTMWTLDAINAFDAWDKLDKAGVEDYAVSVAVLDEGCMLNHEDLEDAIVGWHDATGYFGDTAKNGLLGERVNHGTAACGVIGEVEGNDIGSLGVGHNKVGVVPVNVFKWYDISPLGDHPTFGAQTTDIVNGLRWVEQHAKEYDIRVINLSLARSTVDADSAVTAAAMDCMANNIFPIAAAGNDSSVESTAPGDVIPWGLNVTALDKRGGTLAPANYTNYNAPGSTSKLICAPVDTMTCGWDASDKRKAGESYQGSYDLFDGTSCASPTVAGVAALVSAANPSLSSYEVRDVLTGTANNEVLGRPEFDAYSGLGMVDAGAAVDKALKAGKGTADGGNPLRGATVTAVDARKLRYDGKAKTPDIKVTLNGSDLRRNTDYTVEYDNNIAAGLARVAVKGKGAFEGGRAYGWFTISRSNFATSVSVTGPTTITWRPGGAQNLKVSVKQHGKELLRGQDYEVYLVDGVEDGVELNGEANYALRVGEQVYGIQGIGNFKGDAGEYRLVTVKPKPISDNDVKLHMSDTSVEFTGYPRKPEIEFDLPYDCQPGRDFYVEYQDNINPGRATAVVHGTGRYTGSKKLRFDIVADLGELYKNGKLTCSEIPVQEYTGGAKTPAPEQMVVGTKTLKRNVDYWVKKGAKNVKGWGTVTIAGRSKYFKGAFDLDFDIVARMPKTSIFDVSRTRPYRGEPVEQNPSVYQDYICYKLHDGEDYDVHYFGNDCVGTAVMVLEGADPRSGSVVRTFEITGTPASRQDIGGGEMSAIPDKVYTGQGMCPATTLKLDGKTLRKNIDYREEFFSNCEAGTAYKVVYGIGNYCGATFKSFNIIPKDIGSGVSCTARNKSYDGSPEVECSNLLYKGNALKEGVDFKRTVSDGYYPGTATVTFEGIGNFAGTLAKTAKVTYDLSADGLSAEGFTADECPLELSGFPEQHAALAETGFAVCGGVYDGKAKTPVTGVSFAGKPLVQGSDYTLSYKKNKDAVSGFEDAFGSGGSYQGPEAVIKGKGSYYKGTFEQPFLIARCPMSAVAVEGLVDMKLGEDFDSAQKPVLKLGDITLRKYWYTLTDFLPSDDLGYCRGVGRVLIGADEDETPNFTGATLRTFKVK